MGRVDGGRYPFGNWAPNKLLKNQLRKWQEYQFKIRVPWRIANQPN